MPTKTELQREIARLKAQITALRRDQTFTEEGEEFSIDSCGDLLLTSPDNDLYDICVLTSEALPKFVIWLNKQLSSGE